jgi:predicted house-cleaning noncanonical NTP pyrophosphatase (MazG superfamily)
MLDPLRVSNELVRNIESKLQVEGHTFLRALYLDDLCDSLDLFLDLALLLILSKLALLDLEKVK